MLVVWAGDEQAKGDDMRPEEAEVRRGVWWGFVWFVLWSGRGLGL